MIEDKLTHDERLRLECVAQAVAYSSTTQVRASGEASIVSIAKTFEAYVKDEWA